MSIVDRLFPASELEHLRAVPYDFHIEAPTVKRRKLSSSASSVSSNKRRASSDSGYSSDGSSRTFESCEPARKRSRASPSSSTPSPTMQPAPFDQTTLFHPHSTSIKLNNHVRLPLRTQSDVTDVSTAERKQHYQQIALARSRPRHSVSDLPTPPYPNGGSSYSSPITNESTLQAQSCVRDVGQGWTAGPKSAPGCSIPARLLDGMRITTDERSMLSSLIPQTYVKPEVEATPVFTYPQWQPPRAAFSEPTQSSFAGIVIGAYEDDDDEYPAPDLDGLDLGQTAHLEGSEIGNVEDFFNIEEASDNTVSDDTSTTETP